MTTDRAGIDTREYYRFLYYADGYGNRDGHLNQGEAWNHLRNLQMNYLYTSGFGNLYGQAFPDFKPGNNVLNNLQQQYETQITVGNNIVDNFHRFATVYGQRPGYPAHVPGWPGAVYGNPQLISYPDIYGVARRDGNSRDISQKDLAPPSFSRDELLAKLFVNIGRQLLG